MAPYLDGPLTSHRSYAFDGEDEVLWELVGPSQRSGFFIDVGCNHPEAGCVSKSFYDDAGWTGINVDPLRHCIEAFKVAQPRSANILAALGEVDQDQVPLYSSEECDHWATIRPGIAARKAMPLVDYVPMVTLSTLLRHGIGGRTKATVEVDWLKVDVEGHEAEVLRGNNWSVCRPRYLCIESREPHLYPMPSFMRWEPYVLAQGYRLAYERLLNRFYERV